MGSKQRLEFCRGKKKEEELTVYSSTYAKIKKKNSLCVVWCMQRQKELTVCGSMVVKEKQQQSLQCVVRCMWRKNNRPYSVWFNVCIGGKRTYYVWFNVCEGNNTELTVYGSMYVKEKQQQSLQCMVQCMRRKKHRTYSVWFDVCEGKTTTELTVYGSMYAKYGFRFSYNLFSLSCTVCCSCTEMKINGEVTIPSSTEGAYSTCLVNVSCDIFWHMIWAVSPPFHFS